MYEKQSISLGHKQMMELRKDPKCPNCSSKEIELDKIENPENPLPQFRVVHIYKCGECGYWTPITDKWTWYPPEMKSDG